MGEGRRRFTPPWSVTDAGGAWIVRDKNGVPLSWHYYREPTQAVPDALTREEAYALAVNFARVPMWLGKA